ncbi:MAG TPA: DsbA family protein [Pseudonocardia sp.]|jgi:hypothetical protein|uniref:DsbA family oxidoreductase n=1 Tax=Pseudonocardia sp. TaxID=60912 RepID=UPI002B4AC3F9|nr:DsbA family protein [Pseudonocardia sp.]HLU58070.1 DsbA family protein [Pseudonocardia sp.]
MEPGLIVYGDFGCPYSYLSSRRADALGAADVRVDWRAVEHDPQLPVIGRRLDQDDHLRIKQELGEVTELLLPGETLPWEPPTLAPNTQAAVAGYAEAYGAGVADDVRRLLFSTYWVDGADIGDPEVLRRRLTGPFLRGNSPSDPLRESGYAVSVARGPITTAAWRRIRAWREEWERLGTRVVPTLVEGDRVLAGVPALRRLGELIVEHGAPVDPELPDPARYPRRRVPAPGWW